MRIVSLTPSATEIVCALGLGGDLVGVGDDSDWPPEAVDAPIVLRQAGSPESAPGRTPAGGARALLGLDEAAFLEARADLVLTGALDPSVRRRITELARAAGSDATVVALDPTSVEGVFNSIVTVGAMTTAEDAALDLVEGLRERLGDIEEQVQERRSAGRAPIRVVALDWLEPPFAAGRWVPEQVRRAGGWELLGLEGGPPTETTWEAIGEVDPEAILLMPAGRHLGQVVRAWERLAKPASWPSIEAVARGQVFAVDAASYFSRPGPRIIDGIELLAELFDPDGFVEVSPVASWTPVA